MKIIEGQKNNRLKKLVWIGCCGVVLALVASNFMMLRQAGETANEVQLSKERQLVEQEFRNQLHMHALDQSQISHWDDALVALEEEVDQEFVEEEIAFWLYRDFDIHMMVLVDPENQSRVAVYEETILEPQKGQKAIDDNMDLVIKARETLSEFLAAQTVPITSFEGIHHPVRSDQPIYATGLRKLNGVLSTVVAQVLVPDGDYPMPTGTPRVLLTFKPVPKSSLNRIGDKLHLEDFALVVGDRPSSEQASKRLGAVPGEGSVWAVWKAGNPSSDIWQAALPIFALAFLAVAAVLARIGWRFGMTVEKLQSSEEQNRFLALHDALTGLPNRLHFDHELEAIVAEGKQERCAILCMDLDRFKSVNDNFGHQAGDMVLKTIAERLSDRVGDTGLISRVGGDEFIILLHDHLDKDSVLFLCDQLIEEACIAIDVPGGMAQVGASIGVAWWPDDALTVKSIIRSADDALYSSKEKGRGTVSCASRLRRKDDQTEADSAVNPIDQLRDEVAKVG